MGSSKHRRTRVAAAVGGAILALTSGQVLASAFALQEQSASGLGNAFAGGAAVAEDASTVFTNPAGMSRMPGIQGVVEGNLICLSAKFSDNGGSHERGPQRCVAGVRLIRKRVAREEEGPQERGRADHSIRAAVNATDVIVFSALITQPLPHGPGWPLIAGRQLAIFINGLAAGLRNSG